MATGTARASRFWSPRSWTPAVALAALLVSAAVSVALAEASCCSGAGGCCASGPCTLEYGASGTVRDAETGEPIAGARVTVNNALSTTSAADGSFSIHGSRPDVCSIDYLVEVVVQAEGYKTHRDPLHSTAPLRHLNVNLAPIPTPSPTPKRTPTPDPCGLPTAPLCPIGEEPECFSGQQCVGCRCKPCLPCPPGYFFTDRTNHCECTHGFHRVSGVVAERPPCEGRMRGVTVRLEPQSDTTATSIGPDAGGSFEFARVAPGDHTLTVEPRCNPYGCWDPLVVHVVDEDVSVQLCPREGSAVKLNVGRAVGAPGSSTVFDVNLDSGARPVASVRHTVSFDPEAPIAATSEASPNCTPNPALDANAVFTFAPPGCTPGADCRAMRAAIDSNQGAIPDGSLYSCQVDISTEPPTSCFSELRCGDLIIAGPTGAPLEGTCEDGSITSQLPLPEVDFHFEVLPEHPAVGEAVEVRVTVSRSGGRARYSLFGAEPILSGDTFPRSGAPSGTVVYHLQAEHSGAASLVMSVTYETELGCRADDVFYGYASARSDPFVLRVLAADRAGCAGDCDHDGRVMVNEVIAGISIALGAGDLETCDAADSDGDGTVAIDDLTRAVRRTLEGCPGDKGAAVR